MEHKTVIEKSLLIEREGKIEVEGTGQVPRHFSKGISQICKRDYSVPS